MVDMKVKVLFFARVRELTECDSTELEVTTRARVQDVWRSVCSQFPGLRDFEKNVILSINQEFALAKTEVQEGDELAVFPPVSGGASPAGNALLTDPDGSFFQIGHSPIQVEALIDQLSQAEDGAVVAFAGVVRNNTGGRKTLYLEYEAYLPMALTKMREIGQTMKRSWNINRVGIAHRLGRLEIGEASVIIVVTSAHRKAAFEACQFAIDTFKKTVPVWKKEFFADGATWVEGEKPT
jgi:molybdopterin converting factor subunit 1